MTEQDNAVTSIVCAIDGSEHSDKAVAFAVDTAERYQAALCFVHVLMNGMGTEELRHFSTHPELKDLVTTELNRLETAAVAGVGPHAVPYLPPPAPELYRTIAEVVTKSAKLHATTHGVDRASVVIVDGNPAAQILEQAKTLQADLIVMGHRGLGFFRSLLSGSVAHKVLHDSPCTCVMIK